MVTRPEAAEASRRPTAHGHVRCVVAALAVALAVGAGIPSLAHGEAERPGRLRVLGLSLLLPGLGHRALGYEGRATALMAAEGGIWTSFVTLRVQGKIRKDSYVEAAKVGAGVAKPEGRSDEYYRLLGSYPSADAYDDEIRRDARAHFPNDLHGRAAYFERNRIPDDERWDWASSAVWARYRDKRGDALRSNKRAHYMIGLAVANRLLAAVDGLRLVHRMGQEPKLGFFITGDPLDPTAPAHLGVTLRLP